MQTSPSGGSSKTRRRSPRIGVLGAASANARAHAEQVAGACVRTTSGAARSASVRPGCPGCPPPRLAACAWLVAQALRRAPGARHVATRRLAGVVAILGLRRRRYRHTGFELRHQRPQLRLNRPLVPLEEREHDRHDGARADGVSLPHLCLDRANRRSAHAYCGLLLSVIQPAALLGHRQPREDQASPPRRNRPFPEPE